MENLSIEYMSGNSRKTVTWVAVPIKKKRGGGKCADNDIWKNVDTQFGTKYIPGAKLATRVEFLKDGSSFDISGRTEIGKITNPATGKTYVIYEKTLADEIMPETVECSVYRFSVNEPFKIL